MSQVWIDVVEIMTMGRIKEKWPNGINKQELAKFYGLTNVDTAIPQQLFDQLASDKFDPWGHYVYDYSRWSFGVLFPLTQEGIKWMELNLDMPFIDPRKP